MKSLIIIVCTLAFVSTTIGTPAFGVRGGLNLANSNQDPSEGYDTKIKPGLIIGGSMEFSLSQSNRTTLRLEGLYVQKGWKEEGSIFFPGYGNLDYTGTASIDELIVTPFLVLRFPSEQITPFLQVGPELGFNLSAEAEAKAAGTSASDDIKDWSSTNFGINIGGGIAIPSGKGEVILDARYNLGLMNMYTGNADWTARTNGIQFLVGYNFSVPQK